MQNKEALLEEARQLVYRLERISADSIWARRSSGHRGVLLKWIEALEAEGGQKETGGDFTDLSTLESLIGKGYQFLENAARERLS